jgi:hypothetical protein
VLYRSQMRYKDHRDPEYWIMRIRTQEWAEHQTVSLLDITGVGRATIKALWGVGVTTAKMLIDANPEELARQLQARGIPQCRPEDAPDIVRGWQREAEQLWKVKESLRENAKPSEQE